MMKPLHIFHKKIKPYVLIVLLIPLSHQADTPDIKVSSPYSLKARTLQQHIRTYNEQAPPDEQIYDLASYKKFYKNIPNAPEDPFKYYKNFSEILNELYFTYPQFLAKLKKHNATHSIYKKIHNDESYGWFHRMLTQKAPPYPLQFYKKEWLGWTGILHECKYAFK